MIGFPWFVLDDEPPFDGFLVFVTPQVVTFVIIEKSLSGG